MEDIFWKDCKEANYENITLYLDKELEYFLTKNNNDNQTILDKGLIYAIDDEFEKPKEVFKIVKLLLNKGADIHVSYDYPIRWAYLRDNFQIFKYLFEKGANICHQEKRNDIINNSFFSINDECQFKTYLEAKIGFQITKYVDPIFFRACQHQNLEVSQYLQNNVVSPQFLENLLVTCIKNNNIELIKILIDNGLNISNDRFIEFVIEKENTYLFNYLCEKLDIEQYNVLLLHSIRFNKNHLIEIILEKHNWYHFNLIKIAIENNKLECLKILLKHCHQDKIQEITQITIENNNFEIFNYLTKFNIKFDEELFLSACKIGNFEIMKYIYEKIKITDKQTCLKVVCKHGHLDILKFFIENKFDIHFEDEILFKIAVKCSQIKIINCLYENGVNIYLNDKWSFKYAAKNNLIEVLKYFVSINYHYQDILLKTLRKTYQNINNVNVDTVQYLIEIGADKRVVPKHLWKKFNLS